MSEQSKSMTAKGLGDWLLRQPEDLTVHVMDATGRVLPIADAVVSTAMTVPDDFVFGPGVFIEIAQVVPVIAEPSTTEDPERIERLRVEALSRAISSTTGYQTPDEIIERANEFFTFLLGGKDA